MVNIAVASMFRNSEVWHGRQINQVDKFFNSILGQEGGSKHFDLTFHLVEGNSTDTTLKKLRYWQSIFPDITLYQKQVKGSEVASVVSETRFKNLSSVGNVALQAARDSGTDYVLWMESDLIPPANLAISLLLPFMEESAEQSIFAVAPVPVFHQGGRKLFYDTWAFEGSDGQKWGNGDLDKLVKTSTCLRSMNSIGSCALLNGSILREHRLDFGEGCFPALCKSGREAGYGVYCDVTVEVQHPCNENVNGRLI
jgi:hypothetical protein